MTQSGPGNDRDPIPFEEVEPKVAPRAVEAPTRRAATPAGVHGSSPAKSKCPRCGYSLQGLEGARCPECGFDGKSAVAMSRRERAAREQKSEYVKWLGLVALGLVIMAVATTFAGWMNGELADVPMQIVAGIVKYIILVPIGFAAYSLLAMIWFGNDNPAGITILRLAAAYALADAISAVVSLVFILFLTQALIFIGYVALLMKFLELDAVEAMVLALVTAVFRFIVIVWILHMMGVF